MKTPAGLHNVARELERRGFARHEVAQMMGGNWMRIFRQTFG
jgi:microsomal dipeptidase-like Zn-dependent dipeptidase